MTQTTRKLIVRAIGDIQIWGLTKGPVSGCTPHAFGLYLPLCEYCRRVMTGGN